MTARLTNLQARRLFLARHGLAEPPGAPLNRGDLPARIAALGFVQLDSIRVAERAHHHILFSRARRYRQDWLTHHLERRRTLFEHWTHDAAILPVEWFPYWKHRFPRFRADIMARPWWRRRLGPEPERFLDRLYRHVAENGPVRTRDLEDDGPARAAGEAAGASFWGWRPSKSGLEFLWRTGRLAVARREGFEKLFDLVERVIPPEQRHAEVSAADFLDWCCAGALDRLGIATPGELARFWGGLASAEAAGWAAARPRRTVVAEGADGSGREMLARADLPALLDRLPPPPSGLRILSPFDPVLRDRRRTLWLFGFDYRFEAFIPAAQRRYGHYVFPLLEGDRLIGRIAMKAVRDAGTLQAGEPWLEPRYRLGPARRRRLERELERWRRFTGMERLAFPA